MSNNPNETDFDNLLSGLEDLLRSPLDPAKPGEKKIVFKPGVTGDLWENPGDEHKVTSPEDLYASFLVGRKGACDYNVTLGVFTCDTCGCLHVNLFFDARLVMEFKVTPSGDVGLKPHFRFVKKSKKD